MITTILGHPYAKIAILLAFVGIATLAGWFYHRTTVLEADLEASNLTVSAQAIVIETCQKDTATIEGVARDRQNRINALNKSVRDNRLRAETARCVPITR